MWGTRWEVTFFLEVSMIKSVMSAKEANTVNEWSSLRPVSSAWKVNKYIRISFNLHIFGPVTLATLRIFLGPLKNITSLLRSSWISSNFNPPEPTQEPEVK